MEPKLVGSRFSVTALVVISIMFWGVTFSGDWQRYSVDEKPPKDVIAVAIGDVDNDGDNEVVTGVDGMPIRIYDGAKASWSFEEIGEKPKVTSLVVTDADNDGELEIVCGTKDKRVLLYELRRTEWSEFRGTVWIERVVDPNAGTDVLSVACGDADNDSYIEIVAGTKKGKKVYLYEGAEDSWARVTVDEDAGKEVMALAVGDVDQDGIVEIVCGTKGKKVYAYEKIGESWERTLIDSVAGSAVRQIDIGDSDGDGAVEVVVGTDKNGVHQYKWDGTSWLKEVIDENLKGKVYGVNVCDVYDDGSRGVAVLVRNKEKDRDSNRLLLYEKGPSGWTSREIDPEIVGEASALAIGDADDDGRTELLVGTSKKKKNLFIYDQWAFYGLQKVKGTDDIVLNWPSDPGATYEVFYSSQPYTGFQYAANVSAVTDTAEWIDDGSVIGIHPRDVVARYYRVRVKGSNNFSNTVGKFTRTLETEMHLMSMPLIPYSTSIQDVIGDQLTGAPDEAYADRVWKWDAEINDFSYAWLVAEVGLVSYDGAWWTSGRFEPSAMTLDFGEGFFIQSRHENQKVTFLGAVPEGVVSLADIRPGLQMIGTPSPEVLSLDSCGFQSSGATGAPSELLADRLWYWDEDNLFYTYSWLADTTVAGENDRWWSSDPLGPTEMTMIPGHGYWYQARGVGFTWKFER